MSLLTRKLADFIFKNKPKRKPDFLIGPNSADPYMERWWIIPRNKYLNIYLHHMRHDDDDRAPHDHPWWSISLCLDGKIQEERMFVKEDTGDSNTGYTDTYGRNWETNNVQKGDIVLRPSYYTHRLVLPEGNAWTLFITGPRMRHWGFHCPRGFVTWENFTDPKDKGAVGRGCGEME
jgi:hypothetical protein